MARRDPVRPSASAQEPTASQTPSASQAPIETFPNVNTGNLIDIGARGTWYAAGSDEARYQRYRDLRNGPTADFFRFGKDTDKSAYTVLAEHVDQILAPRGQLEAALSKIDKLVHDFERRLLTRRITDPAQLNWGIDLRVAAGSVNPLVRLYQFHDISERLNGGRVRMILPLIIARHQGGNLTLLAADEEQHSSRT